MLTSIYHILLLVVPKSCKVMFGDRSFATAAPRKGPSMNKRHHSKGLISVQGFKQWHLFNLKNKAWIKYYCKVLYIRSIRVYDIPVNSLLQSTGLTTYTWYETRWSLKTVVLCLNITPRWSVHCSTSLYETHKCIRDMYILGDTYLREYASKVSDTQLKHTNWAGISCVVLLASCCPMVCLGKPQRNY